MAQYKLIYPSTLPTQDKRISALKFHKNIVDHKRCRSGGLHKQTVKNMMDSHTIINLFLSALRTTSSTTKVKRKSI